MAKQKNQSKPKQAAVKGGAPAKAPAKKKSPARKTPKGPNILARTRQFFREVRIELKKVSWPSRKETMASTTVVIVLVFLVSFYLGLVDIGISRLIKYIIR